MCGQPRYALARGSDSNCSGSALGLPPRQPRPPPREPREPRQVQVKVGAALDWLKQGGGEPHERPPRAERLPTRAPRVVRQSTPERFGFAKEEFAKEELARKSLSGSTRSSSLSSSRSTSSVSSCSSQDLRGSKSSEAPSASPTAKELPAPSASPSPDKARSSPDKASSKAMMAPVVQPAAPEKTPSRRASMLPGNPAVFQTVVLDRLQELCGNNEEAVILAEYIVMMMARSNGWEDTVLEIKAFFKNETQAESFLTWLEKCKMRFLTGEPPSPAKPAAAKPAAAKLSIPAKPVSQAPPSVVPARSSAKRALSSAADSRTRAKLLKTTTPPKSEKRKKNELLESMTKNLQQILTKLGDKGLADDMREKYQNLAQNIKMQMAKISKPEVKFSKVSRR